jgi:hypothetical protein
MFDQELEHAAAKLTSLPTDPGMRYDMVRGKQIRRLLLPKTEQHIYFSVEADSVVVHTIWGARRGRGPKL